MAVLLRLWGSPRMPRPKRSKKRTGGKLLSEFREDFHGKPRRGVGVFFVFFELKKKKKQHPSSLSSFSYRAELFSLSRSLLPGSLLLLRGDNPREHR